MRANVVPHCSSVRTGRAWSTKDSFLAICWSSESEGPVIIPSDEA